MYKKSHVYAPAPPGVTDEDALPIQEFVADNIFNYNEWDEL